MDVASGEHGDVLHQLTSIVKNGRLIYNQDSESCSLALSSEGKALMKIFNYLSHFNSPTVQTTHYFKLVDELKEDLKRDNDKKKPNNKNRPVYAVPFHTQVSVLLNRTWRTIWREKVHNRFNFAYC